jgi:Lar family restriction alleviation protein
MAELKPCPFCGSKDIEIIQWGKSEKARVYEVYCHGCAVHRYNSFEQKAISEWNRRADNG